MSQSSQAPGRPPSEESRIETHVHAEWLEQLAQGHWRTPIFYEMVSAEIARLAGDRRPTILDIGCGKGFDGELRFQELLARRAGRFIGIEPDASMQLPQLFSEVFRTTLEDAPIQPASVDIAYAVMVMEHVAAPKAFWDRLGEILAPGGVFLAFSVNGAHWFAKVSRLLGAARLKTPYLNLLLGRRGVERYEDYPVYYRTNTAAQIARFANGFRSVEVVPCGPVGVVAAYAPAMLKPAVAAFDRIAYRLWRQPINLIIRAAR